MPLPKAFLRLRRQSWYTIPGLKPRLRPNSKYSITSRFGTIEKEGIQHWITTLRNKSSRTWLGKKHKLHKRSLLFYCNSSVILHTQGSGKSLTMAMLARKIQDIINNPQIILVTDRIDLDGQITKTLQKVEVDVINATSGKQLVGCIEYVIMHELCHTVHKHHNQDFSALLTLMMPDWEKRKEKLDSFA